MPDPNPYESNHTGGITRYRTVVNPWNGNGRSLDRSSRSYVPVGLKAYPAAVFSLHKSIPTAE